MTTLKKISPEALRLLNEAKKNIKKKYGEEAFLDTANPRAYQTISTGSAIIDDAIGIKGKSGFPKGRIVEIFGPEASGKTSLAMSAIASAQREDPDKLVLIVDAEQAFDLNYAKLFGIDIDPDRLIFCQPGCAEEALEILQTMGETGLFSIMLLDSIPAMATKAQLEKAPDEKTMGALAGVLSVELNKLKTICNKTDTILICINQIRSKVGFVLGSAETTPGGKALPYYSSLRIRISKTDSITDSSKNVIGQSLNIKFIKNKVGTPFRVVTTDLIFGQGYNFELEYLKIAAKKSIINKGGAWYSWITSDGTETKHQGEVRAQEFLKNNPQELEHLKKLVEASQEITDLPVEVLSEEKQEQTAEDSE